MTPIAPARPLFRLLPIAGVTLGLTILLFPTARGVATPANKVALARHFDRFLAKELNRCTTCHLPSDRKAPESLSEFPHNPFGNRLRRLGEELAAQGNKADIPQRLARILAEDADGDGTSNETELLLGHNPGDADDKPTEGELKTAASKAAEFAKFASSYRWQPFETVRRPAVPFIRNRRWLRNPIDAFVAAEQEARGLAPRVEASREVLLRRVYLDLLGLLPTPSEQHAFLADNSSDAYEKVVDRLLADPRHGERWGRHWMDVWRYSDWAGWADGGQIRDSKPHIWRWRDWIVESLNGDKPYDRMLMEMLAADELAPEDTNALRATGFLVRNYKMLSREQWLEDTVKHTAQAFLGVTVGCAKCHDHMTDPISQKEYYQMRAIFEPHQVRTDKVPGQTNTALDGLVRVFDVGTNPPTWLFHRGDERHPDTNRVIAPGVPAALGGNLNVESIELSRLASTPDRRDFVIRDTVEASRKALAVARRAFESARTNVALKPEQWPERELTLAVAESRHAALLAVVNTETIENRDGADSAAWKEAATMAAAAQRKLAVEEARLRMHQAEVFQREAERKVGAGANGAQAETNVAKAKDAQEKAAKELEVAKKKTADAERLLAEARKEFAAPVTASFKPRLVDSYPSRSTGRRLAFARWIANPNNPLTARVAMNHIWMRHFGRGLVPTPADFGRNGRPPSHPQLLDWLASELMTQGWSMKAMHRLIVTSSTYRLASTPDESNARLDPDNVYLWRMNSRRLEAEAVRDNLLQVGGGLDLTLGGPDIDHKLGLASKRRSIYLRLAAEKEVEFLKIFDGPSVTECYERRPSVVPQQALALANNELALSQARALALRLSPEADAECFVVRAFEQVLARRPRPDEVRLCTQFLLQNGRHAGSGNPPGDILVSPHAGTSAASLISPDRSYENLILVLMNHNDFVTIR